MARTPTRTPSPGLARRSATTPTMETEEEAALRRKKQAEKRELAKNRNKGTAAAAAAEEATTPTRTTNPTPTKKKKTPGSRSKSAKKQEQETFVDAMEVEDQDEESLSVPTKTSPYRTRSAAREEEKSPMKRSVATPRTKKHATIIVDDSLEVSSDEEEENAESVGAPAVAPARASQQPEPQNTTKQQETVFLVIGSGGDGRGNDTVDGCIRKYAHLAVLATQSDHFKEMMEQQNYNTQNRGGIKIHLPDMNTATWDLMMDLVMSATTRINTGVTVREVMTVACGFDKYRFAKGHNLCDTTLCTYFGSLGQCEQASMLNLDEVVDAVVVSKTANLRQAYALGRHYIKTKLKLIKRFPYGPVMFTERHVAKLVPVFLDLLNESAEVDVDGSKILPLSWATNSIRRQDIEAALFPRLFVAECRFHHFHCAFAGDFVEVIHVSAFGVNCNLEVGAGGWFYHGVQKQGSYYDQRQWDGHQIELKKDDHHGQNWVLSVKHVGGNELTTLWVAPNSSNLGYPPKLGWQPADVQVRGKTAPKLQYQCKRDL